MRGPERDALERRWEGFWGEWRAGWQVLIDEMVCGSRIVAEVSVDSFQARFEDGFFLWLEMWDGRGACGEVGGT